AASVQHGHRAMVAALDEARPHHLGENLAASVRLDHIADGSPWPIPTRRRSRDAQEGGHPAPSGGQRCSSRDDKTDISIIGVSIRGPVTSPYRDTIEAFLDSGVPRHTLGLVYGRRRIGKSTLLDQITVERGGFYWEAT